MTTAVRLEDIPLPLRVDADGTVRVGKTRVTLDTVVGAHLDGERPEAIVGSYDTLDLADVYAVISYYLRHREQVDAHLAEQEREADELRRRLLTAAEESKP